MERQAIKTRGIRKPLAIVAGWFALYLLLFLPVLFYHRVSLSSSQAAAAKNSPHPANEKHAAATKGETVFWSDNDNDGIPDGAEMKSFQDRENFRRWFTSIAELQFYRTSDAWNPEQRDCAGLVRFAWREALRPHNAAWFRRMGPEYEPVANDVASFKLEQNPLAEKLFRTDFGSFNRSDLANGTFAEFADARSLKSFNTTFVGRDRSQAEPGDLVFFYQPWVQKQPYHVMIFLGAAQFSEERSRDWVVYHTGQSRTDSGTVKKVQLSVLDQHPDPRWRPVAGNHNFLGFYRLKILD